MTPTSRTLHELRKRGYIACVVEQWQTFPERNLAEAMSQQARLLKTGKWLAEQIGMLPDLSSVYNVQVWDKIVAVLAAEQEKNKAERIVRIRKDAFGFGDILASHPGTPGALLVQACVTGDQSKRLAKIYETPEAQKWLESPGNRIEVHGWALRGPRGSRKVWTCTVTQVTLDGFSTQLPAETPPSVRKNSNNPTGRLFDETDPVDAWASSDC